MKKMVLMIMALSFVGVISVSATEGDFAYSNSVREYESFIPNPDEYKQEYLEKKKEK